MAQVNGLSHSVSADECALADTQNATVPERTAWCEDGGCTPGYSRSGCSEGSTDECGCCLTYSPIIVSISGRQIDLSDAAHGAVFDVNGLAARLRIGWPMTVDEGWLVLDRNGNGRVDHGGELFGNTTALRSGAIARHGYEALAEFDVNRDRLIDSRDPIFVSLRLWLDGNRNGTAETGELITPSAAGIVAFSTDWRESRRHDRHGNWFRYRAKVFYNHAPRERFSYDVFPVFQAVTP